MSVLWTSREADVAVRGRSTKSWTATGVSIDSRTVAAGDLFIALDGDSRDGHEFVADALKRGAAAAMVSRPNDEMAEAGALLIVDDTLDALNRLGRAGRARSAAKIVAVTGSVGKTSTKEGLRFLLAAQAATHASAASYNNHWGVPLSLARMPDTTVYGVFEIGMNHAGEITPLSKLVRPHVAIITTVAPVHLEFFDSVDGIADAKAEIFEGLVRGGTAILNRDNDYFQRLAARASACGAGTIIGFGEDPASDARLLSVEEDAAGSAVEADICGTRLSFRVGQPGRHVVLNSLAMLAAVQALGADVDAAASALAGLEAVSGRGVRHDLDTAMGPLTLIDESYNANPASMRAAISVLATLPTGEGGRRIAVLGDMRELGATADALHAALAEPLAAAGIDRVYACGPHMKALFDALPDAQRGAWQAVSEDLVPVLCSELRGGDVIMIKGSLGTNMAPLVTAVLALEAEAAQSMGGR